MSEIRDALYARIAADATLTAVPPGGLGFVVLSRWPKPDGPGATPEAFTGPRLKRTVVVLDAGEAAHPSPRGGRKGWEGYDSWPLTYLWSETHQNGHVAIEAADRRLQTILHGQPLTLPSGEKATVEATKDRTPVREDESFPGNLRCERRYRVTGARKIV